MKKKIVFLREEDMKMKYGQSPWGGNVLVDDTALLLNGDGARCKDCKKVIRNEYLKEGLCPDCFLKKFDIPSPVLIKSNARRHSGCACGEAGEAD